LEINQGYTTMHSQPIIKSSNVFSQLHTVSKHQIELASLVTYMQSYI